MPPAKGSGPLPDLRRRHSELAVTVGGQDDTRLVVAQTDELVDAVDTAANVLGPLGPGGLRDPETGG